MDVNNPVIQLCIKGSQAELARKIDLANSFYQQAWELSTDDYEACISAHYLARTQTTLEEVLEWNKKALDHADLSDDPKIKEMYPSLYLNMGKSYEDSQDYAEALHYYQLGLDSVKDEPPGSYGEMIKASFIEKIEEL